MIKSASLRGVETGHVSKGDWIVVTAGHPFWVDGTANMVKVKRI